MVEVLVRIKRAVLSGHYAFSEKALLNAVAIYKRLRSRSLLHRGQLEYLYVIQSTNLEGVMIYSKGKLVRERGEDHFYFLISSKRAL